VNGYLLDNNAVGHWFSKQACLCARIRALGADPPLFVSAIILGEIEWGHKICPTTDKAQRKQYEEFIAKNLHHHVLNVGLHTAEPYAYLRSNLFLKSAPKSYRQKRPEMWEDPLTGHQLGIDENDLWTAAQAIEHNLILVTSDKLLRLRDADPDSRLLIENWTKPPAGTR
jgi:tRNA(fMet)-specific endonuclease VapC